MTQVNDSIRRFSITDEDLVVHSFTDQDLQDVRGVVDFGQLAFKWDESDHPRGQPGNKGEFAPKTGGSGGSSSSGNSNKSPIPHGTDHTPAEHSKYDQYVATMKKSGLEPREKNDWIAHMRAIQKRIDEMNKKDQPAETPKPAEVQKPVEPEKPKSTLSDDQRELLDKMDVILNDKHPARGRMAPHEIMQSTLAVVSREELENLANHKEVNPEQQAAIRKELERRDFEIARKKYAEAREKAKKDAEDAAKASAIQSRKTKLPMEAVSKIEGHGPTVKHVSSALNSIARVHKIPESMPAIPVKTNTKKTTAGEFSRFYNGSPAGIEISKLSDHPRMTFAHEFGHFLDNHVGGGNFKSESPGKDEKYSKILDMIDKSGSIAKLRELHSNPKVKVWVNHQTLGKVLTETRFDWNHISYLLTPREMFARAYAQYVAHRGEDQSMKSELEKCLNSDYPRQWAADDFEPIAKAFDEYFEANGMREGGKSEPKGGE